MVRPSGYVFSLVLCACGGADASGAGQGGGQAGTPGSAGVAGAGTGGIGSGGATNGGAMTGGGAGSAGAAGTPSTAKCDPMGRFSAPVPLEGLNTADFDEAAARFSPDELTVFFERANDLFSARRETLASPFVDVARVEPLSESDDEGAPWISADGLTLLYESSASSDIYLAQRPDLAAPFELLRVLDLDSAGDASDPYVVGGASGRLYFAQGDAQARDAAIAVADLVDWQPGTPATLDTLPNDAPDRPVLSADELTIYYTPTLVSLWMIARAHRPSRDEPFGEPTDLNELDLGDINYASWISPDGCRLYFDAGASQARDLFVAEMLP